MKPSLAWIVAAAISLALHAGLLAFLPHPGVIASPSAPASIAFAAEDPAGSALQAEKVAEDTASAVVGSAPPGGIVSEPGTASVAEPVQDAGPPSSTDAPAAPSAATPAGEQPGAADSLSADASAVPQSDVALAAPIEDGVAAAQSLPTAESGSLSSEPAEPVQPDVAVETAQPPAGSVNAAEPAEPVEATAAPVGPEVPAETALPSSDSASAAGTAEPAVSSSLAPTAIVEPSLPAAAAPEPEPAAVLTDEAASPTGSEQAMADAPGSGAAGQSQGASQGSGETPSAASAEENASPPVPQRQAALQQRQSPPPPLPLSSSQQIASFVREQGTGRCFLAVPRVIADGSATLEGFAADETVVAQFQSKFTAALNARLSLAPTVIRAPQCSAIDFLSVIGRGQARFGLSLGSDDVPDGSDLIAVIDRPGKPFLSLYVVDDEGTVFDVSKYVQREGSRLVLRAPVHLRPGGSGKPQLLIALSTAADSGIFAPQAGLKADGVFPSVLDEIRARAIGSDAAFVTFRVH